jgi:hypothetical protein
MEENVFHLDDSDADLLEAKLIGCIGQSRSVPLKLSHLEYELLRSGHLHHTPADSWVQHHLRV